MEERKETDYSPMLENARLEVKWFAMQMTFDIQSYITCLGHVSVLVVDDDDILPVVLISSYVGVMCEDCQMMRKTASVPHGSTGRAVADSRLHDPAMMMTTMMLLLLSDGDMPWNTLVYL